MPSLDLFHPLRYWNDEPLLIPEGDANDSTNDAENSLSDRYAFSLGEEIGQYRQHPPEEGDADDIRIGYEHGLRMPAKTAGVFVRKILQIRRGALRRSIPVSTRLTLDFLKIISVTVCPVSGVELTQGTQTESDWSIDRLDNEMGYVPGNICILSRRVNELKNADTFQEVATEAHSILDDQGPEGLTADIGNGLMVLEALRIAALMAGPSGLSQVKVASYLPFAMAPGVLGTLIAGLAGIHVGCARTRLEGRPHRRRVDMFKHLGKDMWRESNRLVELLRTDHSKGVHPCEVWFNGSAVSRLMSLRDALYATPPILPNMTDDEALNHVMSGVRSFTPFSRSR